MSFLPTPGRHDLEYVKLWMQLGTDGNYPLVGPDRQIWNNFQDLFALRAREDADVLSDFVTDHFMPTFHRLFGRWVKPRKPGQTTTAVKYSERGILRFVSALATLIAALATITPVVVLYKIKSMHGRLGAMAAFTAAFSLVLSLLTNTKRGDIFAATAAYVFQIVRKCSVAMLRIKVSQLFRSYSSQRMARSREETSLEDVQVYKSS